MVKVAISRRYSRFKALKTHKAAGRASGIPDCCIDYFIGPWRFNHSKAHEDTVSKLGWGYVPCPECVKTGNQATVIMHFPNSGYPLVVRKGKPEKLGPSFRQMTDAEIIAWHLQRLG